MKRLLSISYTIMAFQLAIACGNNNQDHSHEIPGTHTHDDGSTHVDHDTIAPGQQEYLIGDSAEAADSSRHDHPHPHEEAKPHSHGGERPHTH